MSGDYIPVQFLSYQGLSEFGEVCSIKHMYNPLTNDFF